MADSDYQGGIIRWEDPPPPTVGRLPGSARPWALVAAQLRTRPGAWALVDEQLSNPTTVGRIRDGVSWWAPPGSFEAATRVVGGRIHLWARYVGLPDTGSS